MKQTQKDKVAKILRENGYIDNWEAVDRRLTLRLGAIVFNLREDGWTIKTDMVGQGHCIYRLISEPAAQQMRIGL